MPKLATKVTSSILDKFERKSSGQGAIAKSRVGAAGSEIRIHFIYLEWRYEWYYQNRWVTRKINSINWWGYRANKIWNKK